MRAQPVDLIGGFYKDDSLPWSCQDTVNWLPVAAEVAGTRTVKKFSTPPGLKPWQQIGTGPIRGMHDCEGLRLIVSGRYLYRINNVGIGIQIGVIPGVGRVQMTHNQFKTGFQVLVENGQGGGGYVYTTADDTFAKITDEGYPGSISSDYLDSYLLGVEPQGRFWFHSNLADATDYNTLDRYEAEAAPDKIVGLAVSQFEVVVFGQRTIEFFFNSGAQTGTFQNRRQAITRGCASRHTIQKLDNTLFWLGDDGVVYRMDCYAARPVSTRPLEKAISGYNWPEAIAYVWEDRGHKVYYLTFPDGQTYGYDVITGEWHRRESFGMNRWRLSHIINWGRDWFGGDFQSGRIWQIDWDYFLEGDQPIISERTSAVLSDNQSQLVLPNAELILDTGQGPGTIPTSFPLQPSSPSPSGSAPDAALNAPYTPFQYTVTGGTGPYVFSVVAGSVPVGMSLSSTGLLAGTPTVIGNSSFTIRVTDSKGLWGELTDGIAVAAVSLIAGVATIGGGRSQISFDGLAWTNLSSSSQFAGAISAAIGLANGRFAMGGTGVNYRYTDDSGETWLELAASSMSGGDFLNGRFLIAYGTNAGVGRWGVSVDNGSSITYSDTSLGFNLNYIAIGRSNPNIVLAASVFGNRVAISSDAGATFPSQQNFPADFTSHSILADEGLFYFGGDISSRPGVVATPDGTVFPLSKNLDPSLVNGRIVKIVVGRVGSVKTFVCFAATGEAYMTQDYFATTTKLPSFTSGSFRDASHNGSRFIVACSDGLYTSTNPAAGFSPATTQLSTINTVASAPHG